MIWIGLATAAVLGLFLVLVLFARKWTKHFREMTGALRTMGLTVNERPPLAAHGTVEGVGLSIGTERRTTTTATVYDVMTVRARCRVALPDVLIHRRDSEALEFQSTMGFREIDAGDPAFNQEFKTLVADDAAEAFIRGGGLPPSLLALRDPESSTVLEDFRISAGEAALAFRPAWLTTALSQRAVRLLVAVGSGEDALRP